jgi:hypothetical protein
VEDAGSATADELNSAAEATQADIATAQGDPEADDEAGAERDLVHVETDDGDGQKAEGEIELDGVLLRYLVTVEDDEFVLILQTWITDVTVSYEMTAVTGSRFSIPDEPTTAEQAAGTLVFITYPYVREIFTNVTARSPYPAFWLPPLTRLPHGRVTGEESQ